MVATDMTVLHIAAMYGHHDIIAFFASLLTVHQLEISEWLNVQDPIFGMTPVHMMVLSHQAESVEALVHLLRDYDLRETANDVSSDSALFAICSIQTTAGKTLLHLLLQEAEVAVWNTVLLSLAQVIRGRRISSAQWLQLWSCQEHNDENSIMHILSLQASLIGMQLLLQHWRQMMAESEGTIFESNIIKILQLRNVHGETAEDILSRLRQATDLKDRSAPTVTWKDLIEDAWDTSDSVNQKALQCQELLHMFRETLVTGKNKEIEDLSRETISS
jgi:hypothetical protein